MTTINNSTVNSSTTIAHTQQNNQISEATKAKLEAIGIDPLTVSSESQAQQLIENAQNESFAEVLGQENTQRSNNDTTEQQYLSEAQSLADRIGVSYDNDDSISDILSAISTKLNEMMNSAAMNPQQLPIIQAYQIELNRISTNYSAAQAATNNYKNIAEV